MCTIHNVLCGAGLESYTGKLRRYYYLSRVDQVPKIGDRRQRKDIGKYSFANRTIKN
jgi:hypothetical protein